MFAEGLFNGDFRVYFGGQKCELLEDFDNSIPYGVTLANDGLSDNGEMICKMEGTYIGNLNGSFLVEAPYGRSYPDLPVLRLFADNSIGMFQTYASEFSDFMTIFSWNYRRS